MCWGESRPAGSSPGPRRRDRFGAEESSWPRLTHGGGKAPLFGALGAAPDLDLLVGAHSTYTHSLGAVVLTAIAALCGRAGARLAVACAAAVASHVLLDWLGSDTTPPLGIMALWPFTREFYQSPSSCSWPSRADGGCQAFYTQNGMAALRELAILAADRPADRDCLARSGMRAYRPR